MKLELGKKYMRQDGQITSPLCSTGEITFPFIDPKNNIWYRENGTITTCGNDFPTNIIAEYIEPIKTTSASALMKQMIDTLKINPICKCNNPIPSRSNMFLCYHCGGELYPSTLPTDPEKDIAILSSGGTKFETGAVRSSDANHVMYQLISPIGLRRIAETMKEGFDKYGAYNWERGMPIGDLLNHAIKHIYDYLQDPNSPRKEDDLAHAAWNLLAAMHMEETHPNIRHGLRNDRL